MKFKNQWVKFKDQWVKFKDQWVKLNIVEEEVFEVGKLFK